MYNYHNNLSSAHPAVLAVVGVGVRPQAGLVLPGGLRRAARRRSIYDAGNLVAWWLAVPALAFVAWQAFRRRSAALALIVIAFAVQWISWARIDRAAFQYHYYTSLPFVFLALAYFLAELWHGTSRRIWLLARLAAAAAILGPFGLWLLHRPLCAIARVNGHRPGLAGVPDADPGREHLAPRDRDRGRRRRRRRCCSCASCSPCPTRTTPSGSTPSGRAAAGGGARPGRARQPLGDGGHHRRRDLDRVRRGLVADPGRRRLHRSRTSRSSRSRCS